MKLEPRKGRKTMSRIGLRALRWPFTSKQVEEIVSTLDGYKQTFMSALEVDHMYGNLAKKLNTKNLYSPS